MKRDSTRLVVHVIYRFGHGGLENGLVNLINRMHARGLGSRYRHAILCITGYTEFRGRLKDESVQVLSLDKQEGKDPAYNLRLIRMIRRLRPDIVHSRNLPALECAVISRLVGVGGVIHGEHGWDVHDLDGTVRRYRLMRRFSQPFIHRFVALSRHIETWLVRDVGIRAEKVERICNGVDTDRFHPEGTVREDGFVNIAHVGRFEPVKNPGLLIEACARMMHRHPELLKTVRLHMIGDGGLRPELERMVESEGIGEQVRFHGMRDDVPEMLRRMDIYALPSLNEGISNSILEAMASGLPVVATRVGGNPELVEHGVNGFLVPSGDSDAMAEALYRYCADEKLRRRHAAASRRRALDEFSIDAMVDRYVALYDSLP